MSGADATRQRVEEKRRLDLEKWKAKGKARLEHTEKTTAAKKEKKSGNNNNVRRAASRARVRVGGRERDLAEFVREIVGEDAEIPELRNASDANAYLRRVLEGGTDTFATTHTSEELTYEFLSQLEDVKVGLSPTLRDFLLTRPASADDIDSSCAICLVPYTPPEELLTLPCKHFYHQHCIMKWFEDNKKCPCCKQEVTEETLLGQFE